MFELACPVRQRTRSSGAYFVSWQLIGQRFRIELWSVTRYFPEPAVDALAGKPTANHADSRHFPCSFTHTVISWLFTSAILPLLFALK